MLHVCGPRWPRRRRLPQQRPRRMDRLCRLCWLPQLLLASLTRVARVHGELTRRTSRMHHLSRPVPKPLRFRSSCTPSWCSRTCWRHAGRAAARQHDPNNRGLVSFFWPYTATFYTAKNTAKNRCIALYTDTRCVTALHSYTALYTIQLYSYTSLYTIKG